MNDHRIILANMSRLMGEMLERTIDKSPELQVVGVTQELSNLPTLLEKLDAQWVITSLNTDDDIPKSMDDLLLENNLITILALRENGSLAKLKKIELSEVVYQGLSLKELITLLNERYLS
ncbi:MAG: hypothetical protein PVG14_19265 [Anaerolineales bacterium]|jgi:hypothetical protein